MLCHVNFILTYADNADFTCTPVRALPTGTTLVRVGSAGTDGGLFEATYLQPWPVIDLVRGFVAGCDPDIDLASRMHLNVWFEFCLEFNIDVLRARDRHVAAYRQDQIEFEGATPDVVEQRLNTLSRFYDHAHAEGSVTGNPVEC